MISATQAQALLMKTAEERYKKMINDVGKSIEDACRNGKSNVVFAGEPKEISLIARYLITEGYGVSRAKNADRMRVSW